MRKVYVSVFLAALVGTGVAIYAPRLALADDGKNLKVLPHDLSKADIKKIMKAQAAALGVECEFCHNTDDFSQDVKKEKETARGMMKMVGDINKTYFKGKPEVSCITCHNGNKEPKKQK